MLLEPTRAAFADLVEGVAHRPEIRILPAALGERAGAIGAALLARTLPVNVGLCLPVFRSSAALALDIADQAEAEGLDGVFSFDHLFPAGQPHRPALAGLPILAAVAERTSRIRVGTLVSRVGVLEPGVQVTALATLQHLAAGRVIAGLGAGDSLSRPENDALRASDRDRSTSGSPSSANSSRRCGPAGIEVWIGGKSARMRDLAAAEADAWNCWDCPPSDFSRLPERQPRVAAAPGPVRRRPTATSKASCRALAAAGASWAIYGPPPSTDWPAFVTELAGAANRLH